MLAAPIYIVYGTLRHEAFHALAVTLEGAKLIEFVFLPQFREGRGFRWGYVAWEGSIDWLVTAAPYFGDLVTFLVFLLLCMMLPFKHRWLWLNLIILGMASPLVNSLYNYSGGCLFRRNDVGFLLIVLPGLLVHIYFIATMTLYAIGVYAAFRWSRYSRLFVQPADQ